MVGDLSVEHCNRKLKEMVEEHRQTPWSGDVSRRALELRQKYGLGLQMDSEDA